LAAITRVLALTQLKQIYRGSRTILDSSTSSPNPSALLVVGMASGGEWFVRRFLHGFLQRSFWATLNHAHTFSRVHHLTHCPYLSNLLPCPGRYPPTIAYIGNGGVEVGLSEQEMKGISSRHV